MKLSIGDKLALIYTGAGSQRQVAAYVGMSHQQVGRVLHRNLLGESTKYYEANTDISSRIESAYLSYVQAAKLEARRENIPFSAQIPVFSKRIQRQDKTYADRTAARHTHWLTDRLRNFWIATQQQTGKFYAVTVRSIVNLSVYRNNARKRIAASREPQTESALYNKLHFEYKLKEGVKQAPIFTQLTAMNPRLPSDMVLADINNKLQVRHSPAIGEKGTIYADQILMQFDTRKVKYAPDNRKTRRNKKPNKRRYLKK